MARSRSAAADKNIVDLSRAHRNRAVAQAVRATRDRLSLQIDNALYERELLRLHASALRRFVPWLLLQMGTILGAGLLAGGGAAILLWACLAPLPFLPLTALVLRAARRDGADPTRERRLFLAAHFVSGLAWACLILLGCADCALAPTPVLKGAVLIAAMAATAPFVSALRGALALTFALPLAVFVTVVARPGVQDDTAVLALVLLALPFLIYVSGHLHRASVAILSFQSEKDGLIAELETAKSVSDEARLRAEDANLAKSRFLASMSHELRTPLNAILGFSEVMSAEVLGPMTNPTYRDYANDIHQSGQHLLTLINEILDLSRIEAGRYHLSEEPLFLADVVADSCRLVEMKARAKGIGLTPRFEPDLPRLFADRRAVRQIALNLLSNALKFTPPGGAVDVSVGWTAGGGQYLTVRDNGPGIPAEEIPVVLSAFGQGTIAIKSAEQGTGLGLPIVQGLLSIHGGEFTLRSKLREGTEAIAAFPRSRVMEALPAVPVRAVPKRA